MTYTGSIRCEGDTWDLASSVGATATMVAAARAMATRAANPLINDQFAEPLVRAVGVDVLTRLASGELTASDIDDPERPNASMVRMAEHHAVRTKFRAQMPRAHDDNWDLASSVGATATMVAAGRALATKDPRGLINDPFAEPLVRAVGLDFFTKLIDGELDIATTGNLSPGRAQAMIDGIAVRTKYFDDYFRTATDGGVRQVVILAAGLDARAYRLPWPAGTVVYEIDQPQVIDFKTTTLAGIGAKPTAIRRTVYIDLRADWPAALQAAGLDSTAPTAWLAEGMLIYLPPDPRTGCSTTAPNSVLRAARSLPNLSRALWISTQAGYEKWRIRFASTAWTSTWRRWCIPANAATSSTTCAPRAGTLRAQCGPTYSGAMVCPFPPHTTTIRSAKSSSSAVV